MNKQNNSLLIIAALMILAAACARLFVYPPIIAMAIFGGAVIKDKRLAFVLPLVAMFLSDVMFELFTSTRGFYGWEQLAQYGIFALITWLGFLMKKINVLNVLGFSIAGSLVFYFLSNSASFLFDTYNAYTHDFNGYLACMKAGIPFIKIPLISDLVYSCILFGGYYLMERAVFSKPAVERSK